MKELLQRQKWFNAKRKRALHRWLIRIAIVGVACDTIAVAGFKIALFHDPAFGEHLTKFLHISGIFGQACGGCALIVSETRDFFD